MCFWGRDIAFGFVVLCALLCFDSVRTCRGVFRIFCLRFALFFRLSQEDENASGEDQDDAEDHVSVFTVFIFLIPYFFQLAFL